jgi:hypothetical protein
MPLMAATTPTMIFRPRDEQAEVLARHNRIGQRLPKTGPPCVAVKFGCGGKQG